MSAIALERKIAQLNRLTNELALLYIHGFEARRGFLKEIAALTSQLDYEVVNFCLTEDAAISVIDKEIKNLQKQKFGLSTQKMMQYYVFEKEKKAQAFNIILKQVGFIGGGTQVMAGIAVCGASMGYLCASFGSLNVSHGLNNLYENGYYLLFRENRSGWTRDAYRAIAQSIGQNGNHADLAYVSVDLGISAYGLFRNVVREDTFRLFRYINSDFVRNWKTMGPVSLPTEFTVDSVTLTDIYILYKNE
ncbi:MULTISPECIES: DUF4225 domain-containing protein [unclassified Brenneria]|uniref:DUF4225 domain-containing protein n=1 Tax=unclassified Brenneria TaxID=2634434 RepID=UPI0018F0B3B4|nr:DUF4225 domain-containing protein [Brenneria sp. L3-3C-1]MBJ7223700.1 DUF4225 domain-containing protein [Brenneria sp. L3-3C-1]MEE3644942.1 DUF4225 domain-containing protein [Brenneria sp. L3_3C_1]